MGNQLQAIQNQMKDTVAANRWLQPLFSHTVLAFFYGCFLFLYEIKFLRELVPVVHPFLIGWAGIVAIYDIFVRKLWKSVPYWKVLFLFVVSIGLTAALNWNVGIVGNVKAWIMAALPLLAFYPTCLLAEKERAKKVFFSAMVGVALVVFAASLIAVILYLFRFNGTVTFMGMREHIGIRLYDDRFADSGIILYGLYVDTNHAAIYSMVVCAFSVLLFLECRNGLFTHRMTNLIMKIFAAANALVQICYFPLANSRGAWLSLALTLLFVLFLVWKRAPLLAKKRAARYMLSGLCSVACVLVLCVSLLGIRSGISRVSHLISQNIGMVSPPEVPVPPSDSDDPDFPPTTEEPPVDSFQKDNTDFGAGRLSIWKNALKLFAYRPLFGEGPGNNQYYAGKYGIMDPLGYGKAVHNSYLDILLDYGVVGFVLIVGYFVLCAWSVIRRLFGNDVKVDKFNAFLLGMIVFMAISSGLLSCIVINTTAMYFVLLLSLGAIMRVVSPLEYCVKKEK